MSYLYSMVDYQELKKELVGTKILKPISGTLSGHAAGEPFDKHVYSILKREYPNEVFRQYEYLNDLFLKNPKSISIQDRLALFNSPTVMLLLSRGNAPTKGWSVERLFEEKQNDTADIIMYKEGRYELIDVKSHQINIPSQSPNIISSYKLAKMCATMIDNEEYDKFSINYFEIDWKVEGEYLVCVDTHYANLFKTQPSHLYINWASAMQVQFHVSKISQDWSGSVEEWARAYIALFVESAKARSDKMIKDYVTPFLSYII